MDSKKRRSDRCTRPRLRSPGRPPVATRSEQPLFWTVIATGISSEAAAITAGVSQPVGTRWFRKAGAMPPAMFRPAAKPLSGRYLSLLEPKRSRFCSSRGIVSKRSGVGWAVRARRYRVRSGAMRPRAAVPWITARPLPSGTQSDLPVVPRRRSLPGMQRCAPMWKRGSPASCAPVAATRSRGQRCRGRGAGTGRGRTDDGRGNGARNRSPGAWPWTSRMTRRCASAIYQALFVQGRGALRRELTACLRTGRALRIPRARVGLRGKKLRLERHHDLAAPGRSRRPGGAGSLRRRPDPGFRQLGDPHAGRAYDTLHDAAAPAAHGGLWRRAEHQERAGAGETRCRGGAQRDRAQHARRKVDTGVQVYFCDRQSPWQKYLISVSTEPAAARSSPSAGRGAQIWRWRCSCVGWVGGTSPHTGFARRFAIGPTAPTFPVR